MNWDQYEDLVEKAAASKQERTAREVEIEQALNCSMPGLLRRLLDENDGKVRSGLRQLNERLDEAGMDADVSPNTFYDYLDKYRLR
jgi:recombinational DNA repair protein (RecF pathway)